MDAIEDGMYQPAMKTGMEELDHQKAEIEARLAEAPADLPDVHPNIAEHYRAKVIRPAETLAEPESNANPGITPATSGPNGNARGHLKPKSQTFQDYVVRA